MKITEPNRQAHRAIHVFKAADGKWTYCPATVRHWPSFNLEGEFPDKDAAVQAVNRDPSCAGLPVKVEAGFLGG